MIKYYLHRSDVVRQRKNNDYPYQIEITSLEVFKDVISYDHMTARCENNSREKGNKFLATNIFAVDFDNDHSNDPKEWVTIKQTIEKYKDFSFYLSTSKSHNIKKIRDEGEEEKTTDGPRPRFHIYFLLDKEETDAKRIPNAERIKNFDEFMDVSALGAKRFFYGNPNAEVFFNSQGWRFDILDEIESKSKTYKFNLSPKPKGREGYKKLVPGQTTTVAQTYIADLVKRGLNREEVEAIVEQARQEGYAKSERTSANDDWWERTITWSFDNVKAEQSREQETDSIFVEVAFNTVIAMSEEDFSNKYEVVSFDQFANDISSMYYKTLYKRGTAYYRIETDEFLEVKQLADLYKKFVFKLDQRYVSAFYEWDKRTSIYRKIEKSVVHAGEKTINGEKIYYIKDEDAANKILVSPTTQELMNQLKKQTASFVSTTYSLDNQLGGGFRKGSYYAYHGATGISKSYLGLNIATRLATCWQDLSLTPSTVLYLDSENGMQRLVERIGHIHYDINRNDHAGVMMKLLQEKNINLFSNLHLQWIPSWSLSFDGVVDIVDQMKIEPDVIIVDLGNHLLPTKSSDVWWMDDDVLGSDAVRIALQLNCVVIMVFQSNQQDYQADGLVKRNVGLNSVGGGPGKIRAASGFWQMYNDWAHPGKYRGLANAAKSRDFVDDPKDIFLEFTPSSRLLELQIKPSKTEIEIEDAIKGLNKPKIKAELPSDGKL